MFHLIVTLTAHTAEAVPTLQAAIERMRPLCLDEPGCLSWEAFHSTADPRVFTLVEAWETEQSWEEHGEGEAIQTIYLPQICPHAERAVHPSRRVG